MKKCIILANGDCPSRSLVLQLQKMEFTKLICADGGADSARKLKLIPDYIIGDFDSITDQTKSFYKNKSIFIEIKRQNDTDVEKSLKTAIRLGFKEAVLLGATGDRLDHSFCNLGIALKFYEKIHVKILHKHSLLEVCSGNIRINTKVGETISIYGIDIKTKITSTGLKFPIKNIALPFGIRESTSNKASADKVILKIRGGKIFLIRDFIMMRNNDLF